MGKKNVVKIEHLSKKYFLRSQIHQPYRTLRDAISETFTLFSHFGKRREASKKTRLAQKKEDSFYALNDISFDVNEGDIVGIVGRNGAGKSTLLKVLSRITAPTSGRVSVSGRIASLLEVGTGFHPELSGRENIFMNGAILGMKRAEIFKRFDEIVAFAEVEKFIDLPVKRYSSGMYVRLAFSVAAHLDPEILIVDEVLSVGDAAFQRKCLGAMRDVAKGSRTVLFVTHNLPLVRLLCNRAILLDKGRLTADGGIEPVLAEFTKLLQMPQNYSEESFKTRAAQNLTGKVRFNHVEMIDKQGNTNWSFKMGDELTLQGDYTVHEPVYGLSLCLYIKSALSGEVLTSITGEISSKNLTPGSKGTFKIVLPRVSLRPAEYSLYLLMGDRDYVQFYDLLDDDMSFPHLTISSDEKIMRNREGYFSIPALVSET